jgi:hypothetical protein
MPIYEYKGQQYDIATEDQAAAKAKILSYLEKQGGAPAPAASDKAPSAAASALSSTAAQDLAEAQARQDIAAKGPEQVSIPQAELADARRNVAALTRELARKGVDAGPPPAIGSSKAGDYLLAQRAKAQGQQPAPADVVPPAPPVAQTQLAPPPAPPVAQVVPPKPVVAGRFGAFGAGPAAAARVVPPQLSVLEKAPKVVPVVSETQAALNMAGVSPQYVNSLEAEFYQLEPAERAAALQQAMVENLGNTVKGRAVRAVAARHADWVKAASNLPESTALVDPRVESVNARLAVAQGQLEREKKQKAEADAARAKLRAEAAAEEYGPLTAAKDIGLSGAKGAIDLAESATGIADIFSFGLVGKALAKTGYYDPEGAKKFYTGLQSATSRDQQQNVQEAKGFVDSLKAIAVNPAALLDSVVSSLPSMVASGTGGGMLVKQLMTKAAAEAATLKLTGEAAAKFVADKVKSQTLKIVAATSAGEGVLTAGSVAEAGRQKDKDWNTYVLPALSAGLGNAAISMVGGSVARKMGIGDVQTSMATRMAGLKDVGLGTGTPAVQVFKELAKEGFFEEMPQSYQEQIFRNLATGRPWDEGVDEAAAQGLVLGTAMAGGHQASSKVLKATSSLADKTQIKLDEAKEGLRESISKILGVAKTNELLGLREGAYERPGEISPAKLMAEMKRTPFASSSGALNVPSVEKGPTEPKLKDLENVGMQEEEEPGLRGLENVQVEGEPPLFAPPDPVKAEAQRKEAVAALANRIEQEQGIPIEDAERIAANDIAATEAQYRRIAGRGVDLTRMEEIARSHIVAGYPPPVAMEMAAKAVQEERAADALAKETGALDVRKPKSKTGRRGAGVAGEPGTESTAGPETTTRDGVVSTESDAGLAPTGEAPQPGALTETEGTIDGTETVKTEQTETQGQEKPAAVGKPPKAPKPAKVEPAKGDVHTFEEAQENNALGKPVRTGYNLLINGEKVGTYKTKRQAVAASNLTKAEKTGNAELIAKNKKAYDDAIASTGAGRPPRLYPRQKPPTATAPAVESEEAKAKREMDEARAEAAAQEESDRKKAEDFETGTAPKAEGPITVVETQLLKGDALTGASTKVKLSDGSEHEINRQDSITSMGLPGWHDVNAATINSYLADTKAEAIKELIRRQEEKRGTAKKPKGKKATSASEALETEAKEKLEELEDLLKNYNTNPDVASAKASAQRIYRIANDLGAPKAVRDRAKKILADEIDVKDIVTQNKDAIRTSSAVLPGATPDAKFAEFKNASQAIAHVIRTGTKFQQALGNRLRGFVNGVKFVVVEKDQKVPEGLTGARIAKRWEKSIAMYVENYDTGERTVYVRGASFGNRQGLNNTTVLHELLHAATNRKLDLGLQAIKDGASRSTKLVRDTIKLVELMHSSGRLFNDLIKQGKATEGMRLLNAYGDVFSDPKEFLAYGMTDGDMQNFLIQAHGYEEDTPFFTRFVRALRDMFGMGENDTNALSDLIVVSDSILSTRVPVAQRTAGISLSSATTKAKPSVNQQRLAKMLGNKLYGSPQDIAKVSIKELFQNAFDAVKEAMEKSGLALGKVNIKIDDKTRTITVIDNGPGMPTSVMGGQFLQIAGTVKGTDRASGGLGVAKMLFLFENDNLEVVSLRDGVVSRMVTTGDELKAAMAANPVTLFEQLKDFLSPEDIEVIAPAIQASITRMRESGEVVPEIKIETSNDPETVEKYTKTMFPDGQGTAVVVQIPKTYTDTTTGDEKQIDFNKYDLKDISVLTDSPLFGDIDVTVDLGRGADTLPIGANFPKDEYTSFANVKFNWGVARIYVSKEKPTQGMWDGNTFVLSNGLWQFTNNMKDRPGWDGKQIKRKFYIDVSPASNIKPEDPAYPFELNRQGFSKTAEKDFKKIYNYITAIYGQLDLAQGVKNFGTVQYLNRDGTLSKAEVLEPKTPPTDTAFTLIKPTDKVEIKDGVMYVNNRAVPELTNDDLSKTSVRIDELTIPQDELDPSRVMVHDNTIAQTGGTMVPTIDPLRIHYDLLGKDNYKVTVAPEGEGGFLTTNPEHVITGTGEEVDKELLRLGVYKLSEAKSLSDVAREKFGQRYDSYLAGVGRVFMNLRSALVAAHGDYAGLANEVIGTSIDNEYYGVSIKVPFHGMFINPAVTALTDSPAQIALSLIGTMAHELAHFRVRNHGADFASEMQRVLVLLESAPNSDLGMLKKYLTNHVAKNQEIFDFLNKEFRSGNLKPRGNRFQDASNQQIGDESSAQSVEGARTAEGWRPSLSQISEPGTEGAGELDDSTADDSDAEAVELALRTQAQVDRDVKKAAHTFNESVKGQEFSKTISALQMAQDPRKVLPALRALWKRATTSQRNVLVSLPTNEFLADWAGNSVPELTNTAKLMQKMSGMAERLLKAAGELTDEIDRTFRKNPDLRKKLDRITLMSTLAQVDPADPNARLNSEVLDKQWRELGDAGRRLYTRIRNHFDTLSKYYTQLLDDQITKSGLDIAQQANLMKKIRAIYETGSKIVPYFPLMRDGEFWLAIGKGNGRKFFLFKTLEERDNAMQGFADERIVPRKPNESKAQFDKRRADNLQELLGDYDFEHGNNISSMRRASYGSSPMLGEVFEAIDLANLEDIDAKETIKDAVYQVYIQSMPEQSFRKLFMHRKGRAGFRPDILQNTAHASAQMASQLARIKYAPLLRNSLSAARDSISNRPRYEPFVIEMQRRVALNLAPEQQSTAANIAGLLNKASFIYYLGGASSALLQPLSIFQTGMPVLARYGTFNASVQMAKMLKVWNKVGVYKRNIDGTHSFVGPSMEHGALTPFQRKAFKAAEGRKLFASTYASAVFDYKSTPTEELSSPTVKFAKGTVDTLVLGGLMHSTERMSREFIYFSSIDLQVAALKKAEEDLTPEEAEKIIDQAVYDTNEALGNYGEYSRPLFMRSVGGKVLTQFMMYPLHVSLFLLKNFKEMIKPMNGRTRQEAFKKFFGTMLSTYVLGGYVALPMFSTLMGFIGAAFNALKDDDDEIPDWELYVREVLIPDMFEQITIAGKPLSNYLDPELVKTGPLNYFTGADFSGRTQLNNLWLRDTKVHKTFREDAMAFALEKAGPAANMFVAYGEGFEALFAGDYGKAMKKFAPAGFRNFSTAYELYTQGAKDSGGNQLLSKDAFSTGALIFQAVGFRSDALANLQYVNFTVMGIKQKIENERQQILNKLDRADREGDTAAYSKAYKEMEKFNDKHPELEVQISLDTLTESLEARRKQRAETWRGSRLEAAGTYDKYLSASRRKASDVEAKGREK